MLFSSFLFLSVFLPAVLLINFLLPTKFSNVFLLLASLLFYYFGEGSITIILISSILWNYSFGLLMNYRSQKKLFLIICILGNLGLLIYYKYSIFFLNILGITNISDFSYFDNASIFLPLGISFFTFQGISYVTDSYRDQKLIQKNAIKLGLYISLFPQLIAGPIVKYHELSAFLSSRRIKIDDVSQGFFRFTRGLAKKVIIADQLAGVPDLVFGLEIANLSAFDSWIGLLCFSLQIYFDFSAYSDMAIGIGRMMGFTIPENFNYPYFATSFKDFWRRWHISLSTWFRDYVYIPLGGNRKTKSRTYFNLITVFFITGLWHGASYNFIIWGLLHGVFLLFERQSIQIKPPLIVKRFLTFLAVTLAWGLFRVTNLNDAIDLYANLFQFTDGIKNQSYLILNPYMIFIIVIALIFMVPLRPFFNNYVMEKIRAKSETVAMGLKTSFYLSILVYSLTELSTASHHPFIYFKF